jgi:hypothetical protein
MRRIFGVIAAAFALVTAPAAEKDPQAARRLLDGTVEMISAASPETGVVAMFRAGIAYGALDKKKALDLLKQSFAALPGVATEDVRDEYATAIVRAAADLDVRSATELLRQLPKPAQAASSVVRQLLSAKQADEAIELLALMPEQVEYPYDAASYVIASLPADDPRRAIAFGRATVAFGKTPTGPFPVVVERFGKQMPADLRGRAVSLLLQRIQTWKDDSSSFSANAADNETKLEMHTPQQNELREYVAVARMFEPVSVDRLLEQRPDIRSALSGFSKERKPSDPLKLEANDSDDDDDPFYPPFGIGLAENMDGFQKRIEDFLQAKKQADKLADAMKKDPAEAVRLARELPDQIRAEALAIIAGRVQEKDPEMAGSVADTCLLEIERVSNPASRIPALIQLGKLYAKRKDPARAHAAFERALTDVLPLWARDTRASSPNVASRDTWPSVQAVRSVAHEAATQLGAGAEGLLSNMTVNDLVLMARVHMARALLGLSLDIHQINVRWTDSEK